MNISPSLAAALSLSLFASAALASMASLQKH